MELKRLASQIDDMTIDMKLHRNSEARTVKKRKRGVLREQLALQGLHVLRGRVAVHPALAIEQGVR